MFAIITAKGGMELGQAKKDLEEEENKRKRQEEHLINYKGYERCYRCNELFMPEHEGQTVCSPCWEEVMKE